MFAADVVFIQELTTSTQIERERERQRDREGEGGRERADIDKVQSGLAYPASKQGTMKTIIIHLYETHLFDQK